MASKSQRNSMKSATRKTDKGSQRNDLDTAKFLDRMASVARQTRKAERQRVYLESLEREKNG